MLMHDFQTGVRALHDSSTSVEERARSFVQLVSGFLGDSPVALFLADGDGAGFTLKASSKRWRCDQGEIWFDAATTIDALALEEGRLVHLTEPELLPGDGRRRAEQFVFPLVARGERAGVLTVELIGSRPLGEGRRMVLTEAVRQFADLFVQELRMDRLTQRLARLSSVHEVGIALLANTGVGELLRAAAFSSAFVMEAEACVLRLYDPRTRSYAVLETHGLQESHFRERALALEERAATAVLQGGAFLRVGDVDADPVFHGFADAVRDFLCQPLGEGPRPVGAVTVLNKLPANGLVRSAFSAEESALLAQLARYIHSAARNTFLLAAKERVRGFDPLTGLLSMRSFQSLVAAEVQRAQRFQTRFLLLACTVSPLAGSGSRLVAADERTFFKTVGSRIRTAFREYDHVARVGPRRFVVILAEVHNGMTGAPRRIEVAVGEEKDRLRRMGREFQAEIRFSQALYPDDGLTYEALARVAGLTPVKA